MTVTCASKTMIYQTKMLLQDSSLFSDVQILQSADAPDRWSIMRALGETNHPPSRDRPIAHRHPP